MQEVDKSVFPMINNTAALEEEQARQLTLTTGEQYDDPPLRSNCLQDHSQIIADKALPGRRWQVGRPASSSGAGGLFLSIASHPLDRFRRIVDRIRVFVGRTIGSTVSIGPKNSEAGLSIRPSPVCHPTNPVAIPAAEDRYSET